MDATYTAEQLREEALSIEREGRGADEVDSKWLIGLLRAHADALEENARLNKWADGMTDAALKERKTAEEYQRELREENARLKADTSILHQSIGLLTTIDPAMEVDPVNPLGMAEHLTQYVDAIKDRMMGAEAELAKLRQHAEAMADDLDMFAAQPDYDGPLYGPMPSLIAYRADFPEEK